MRHLITATAAALVAAGYAFSCWVWPMRDCWACDGHGHHRPTDGKGKRRKVSRPCRWCRGSGKRLRIGRRVWNRVRRKYRAAQ